MTTYKPDKVVGTDTIRMLTEKVNKVMDGVVAVEETLIKDRESIVNETSGHRHTGLKGDAPQLGIDSLDKEVTNIMETQSCLFWMEV